MKTMQAPRCLAFLLLLLPVLGQVQSAEQENVERALDCGNETMDNGSLGDMVPTPLQTAMPTPTAFAALNNGAETILPPQTTMVPTVSHGVVISPTPASAPVPDQGQITYPTPTKSPAQAQTASPTTRAPVAVPVLTASPTTKAPVSVPVLTASPTMRVLTVAPSTASPISTTASPTTKAPTPAPSTASPISVPVTSAPLTISPTTAAPIPVTTAAPVTGSPTTLSPVLVQTPAPTQSPTLAPTQPPVSLTTPAPTPGNTNNFPVDDCFDCFDFVSPAESPGGDTGTTSVAAKSSGRFGTIPVVAVAVGGAIVLLGVALAGRRRWQHRRGAAAAKGGVDPNDTLGFYADAEDSFEPDSPMSAHDSLAQNRFDDGVGAEPVPEATPRT